MNTGWAVKLTFKISLSLKDFELLENIKNLFGGPLRHPPLLVEGVRLGPLLRYGLESSVAKHPSLPFPTLPFG
jgi:hypothetical protein